MPIHPESRQVMNVENEPSNYSFFSYIGASIVGIVLGVILVYLLIVIFLYALKIAFFIFFLWPLSLLTGSEISLVEFLFG